MNNGTYIVCFWARAVELRTLVECCGAPNTRVHMCKLHVLPDGQRHYRTARVFC